MGYVGKNHVARCAGASMSAFEFRPKRPPHSSFCKEVYKYFRAVGFEAIMHKTAAVVTRGNIKMVAGAPVAPETLTTKRQGAKSRDGREQDLFAKVYFCAQNDWRARGRRAKLEEYFLKKYILYRKSIYFCKKIYLRNPANTRC